ncbi:vomeronasal type-1 receptor 3-like isoform X1 [Bos taurus]|uniref:vomeronasal type-1 receptor 3-like isoform X1 n=1 Tax=Bos taurus TaxID=9913 RepID=UPI0028CB4D43|nr:vomeronasal type-1 receptor 3-like isoform X1 [Bos taurus]XP_059745505.1 vomeronasal type-1 receptor 3-like isoform X1 [Bos taurus]XP_059745508.1 vomeronasal type-1 receptor 3-like isoform X1 [Bos taurus]
MISSDKIFGIFFFFQICIGLMGNSLLFILYMYVFLFLPHKKKPTDVILAHLTFANTLALVFRGVPNILSSFGISPEMGDIGCKAVVYIQRVTRSISLYTTSLQSTFQAVTITLSNSKWVWLKIKMSTFIQPSLLFSWIINMVIYSEIILRNVANRNITDARSGYYAAYCKTDVPNHHIVATFLSAIFTRDLFLLSLMTCSSIYMVTILFRHRKTAQHVRSTIQSPQGSPEIKATKVILMLVSCFVLFYWTNTFLTVYLFSVSGNKWQLESFGNYVASCYPSICPFLLIKNENRISRINYIKTKIRIFSF